MSLFNLIHKSVVLKFAEAAKPQFDPSTAYVFRLTAVDGMGFLEIQEVRLTTDGAHETTGAPFWVNKDLVLELHEHSEDKVFANLRFSGPTVKAAKPAAAAATAAAKAVAKTKISKAKTAALS
jgi:hypothetical protein